MFIWRSERDAYPEINPEGIRGGGCDLVLPLTTAVPFPCHFGTLAAGAALNSSLHSVSIITKQIMREGEACFIQLKVEVD